MLTSKVVLFLSHSRENLSVVNEKKVFSRSQFKTFKSGTQHAFDFEIWWLNSSLILK